MTLPHSLALTPPPLLAPALNLERVSAVCSGSPVHVGGDALCLPEPVWPVCGGWAINPSWVAKPWCQPPGPLNHRAATGKSTPSLGLFPQLGSKRFCTVALRKSMSPYGLACGLRSSSRWAGEASLNSGPSFPDTHQSASGWIADLLQRF